MATPNQGQNGNPPINPANLSANQLLLLLSQNPGFLSEVEHQLPQDQKLQLMRAKVTTLMKHGRGQAQGQASDGQQQQGQGQQAGPKGGRGRAAQQQQQQHQQAQSASPRVQMQQANQVPNQQQMMMQQQQQQQQQQHPTGSQQNFQHLLERQQRLQQNSLQQHQMQQMAAMQPQQQHQAPTPVPQHSQLPMQPNMTAPSPQQGGPSQSPMVHHPSPNPNQPRMNQGPTPPLKSVPTVDTIVQNFPTLLKRKNAGQLQVEQENLFDQFLRTEAGQAALQRFQSQEANAIVQNNLANPVSQNHQMPPMTQAQLQMAAQQQLAPLQQQQQQQAHQAQAQAAAAVAHVQQLAAQQAQFQNLVQGGGHQRMDPQQYQQMQLRQLAQANMTRAQGATNMLNQASAMARAQLHSQQQQQQMGGMDGNQQGQAGGQMGFGSPRPPQGMQPQQQQQPQQQPQQPQGQPAVQQTPQSKAASMRNTIARLSAMPEYQREQIFASKPEIRNVYLANINQMGLANQQGQSPQVGAAATPNAMPNRTPSTGGPNFPIPNNVPVNLHIPAGKQRNSSVGSGPQSQAAQSPQMRPPPQQNQIQPIQPQAGTPGGPNAQPNPAQMATLQRMLQQGIPIQPTGAQGFARPPMNAAMYANAAQQHQQQQQQQQQQHQQQQGPQPQQTPEQLINQASGPSNRGAAAPPQAFRNPSSTEIPTAQQYHDRAHGALARTTWAPTSEYDSSLREKLGEFRPAMRSSGPRRDKVLSDVLLEKLPDEIRAIIDEVEMEGEGDKGAEETSGLPGQKKRKVQELAEGIDKGLVIEEDVETLLLKLADEHIDLVGQFACGLAKHRKSDTLDRKDLQLAYEMFGRVFPAFASDSIRMDQARSNRRIQPASTSVRASRLRAVNEHKALLKREREEARLKKLREEEEEKVEVARAALPNGVNGHGHSSGPPSMIEPLPVAAVV